MRVTGMSEEQLSETILEGGLRYIAQFKTLQVAESRRFWSWFKLYWYSHDAGFLALHKGYTATRADYLSYHLKELRHADLNSHLLLAIRKELKQKEAVCA